MQRRVIRSVERAPSLTNRAATLGCSKHLRPRTTTAPTQLWARDDTAEGNAPGRDDANWSAPSQGPSLLKPPLPQSQQQRTTTGATPQRVYESARCRPLPGSPKKHGPTKSEKRIMRRPYNDMPLSRERRIRYSLYFGLFRRSSAAAAG